MKKVIQIPIEYNGVLFVGEAPGREEITSIRYDKKYEGYKGNPFIGPEGRYLRNVAEKAGFNLSQCVITNTVHKQPTKNKYYNLSKGDIEAGREELIKDINKWKPNLIVACGGEALNMLTGKSAITKYRGAVMPCELVDGYKVLPTVHPGFIFKGNQQYAAVLNVDLKKANMEKLFPQIKFPKRIIDVIRDAWDACELLKRLSKSKTMHAIDIETAGPQLLAYGIATSREQAYVIDKHLCKNSEVLKAISQYANSDVPKMYHNALYDVFYMAHYYRILHKNTAYDTMLAQHAIYPTLPKSLGFCGSFYTNEPYWKDEGKEMFDDIRKNKIINWEDFYVYNGKDCCLTYEVYEEQQDEIATWGVQPAVNLMRRCIEPALFSQMKGLRVSDESIEEFKNNNEKALEVLDRIRKHALGDINVGSYKQLRSLIYDQWRLPVQRSKGKITSDLNALRKLEKLPTPMKPHLGLIMKIKKHRKLRDFYTIVKDDDGRVRFSHKLHGTITGRWASSKSITGSGFNLQNQPKSVRHFYIADEGKVLFQPDLSNAEARFVAAICGDLEWLKGFDIEDQHSKLATQLFDIPLEKVRDKYIAGKSYRDYAKKNAHATHYLEGIMGTATTLGCPVNVAKALRTKYFTLRPKIKDWHAWVNSEVRKKRYIRTAFGRVIQFFGPRFADLLPSAVAAEPQSTSVDYLTHGMLNCIDNIPEFEFLQQGHDSYLAQFPDDINFLRRVLPLVQELMCFDIQVHGTTVRVPIDFSLGYKWGKMHEFKNVNELDKVYEKLENEKRSGC